MLFYTLYNVYVEVYSMRTNIVIDDALMLEAKQLTGLSTMKDVVNEALTELVQRKKVRQLSDLEGKIHFYDGYDYKAMRKLRS